MSNLVKGLLTIAAKKDIRYYLNGIHVVCGDDGIFKMEASDGHSGMILTIKSEMFNVKPNTDVILCGASLANLLKLFGSKAKPTFSISNESARIGEYNVEFIDGRYPDLARAMRLYSGATSTPCSEIGLDLSKLAAVCKSCELVLHNNKFKGAKLTLRDASDSVLITQTFNKVDTLQVALMPTRL
jgi:DNA polymerase III sliding clamp (beta) subunit (PCNA family)